MGSEAPHWSLVTRSWDFQTDTLNWSQQVYLLLGYDAAILSTHNSGFWKECIHADDRERVLHSLSRCVTSDARFWCEEYQLLAADGSYVTVIDQLAISRHPQTRAALSAAGQLWNPVQRSQVESITNTDRNSMLNTIRSGYGTDTTILLNTILSNTTSGLFCMDSRGYPTYLNEAAEKITGYKLEEICHRPLHYAVHYLKPDGSPYPMHECPIDNAQAKLTAAQNQTEIFVDKNGRLFPVVWSVRPLEERGRTIGAVIEFRDVTEEQAIEKEKVNAMLELRHAEARAAEGARHQKALSEFIDYLSHELRNPLHGISANTEFLMEAVKKMDMAMDVITRATPPTTRHRVKSQADAMPDPLFIVTNALLEAKGYLFSIRECCRHQSTITDSVLDLSRLESGNVALSHDPFDPVDALEQSLEMIFARGREKKVSIRLDSAIKHNECLIKGDNLRLRQIVLNLLSNSVKFTEANKSITLALGLPVREAGFVELRITVIDEGSGMTPDELAGLFKRFGKTSMSVSKGYSGSGLGLSICAELVRLLGGQITVQSQKGIGTQITFSARFEEMTPAECQQFLGQSMMLPMETNATPKMSSCAEKFQNVLVAEDNALNQKVMAKYLDNLGYNYVMTNDGLEALERFQAKDLPPIDFVLLDIEMPRMDGREAAKAIRAFERVEGSLAVPIVALSGNARKEQVNDALAIGFNDYLTKPCKKDVLLAMLQKWENARSN